MENKNVITTDILNSPQIPIKLPQQQQDLTNFGGITDGVYNTLSNEYNVANKNLENLRATQNTTGTDIVKMMEEMTGKTSDTVSAQGEAGVNVAQKDVEKYAQTVGDLQAQASVLNREAQAIPIQIQEQFKGTGATDIGVAPIQTAKLRENALKALSIAQQQDIASAALTGSQIRLQAAKDKAQQIIDLKYKPLEDRLAIKKQQYELNKDVLESYDKKRTEALNAKLKEEERRLTEQKQTEKDIRSIYIDAISGGATTEQQNKILSSTTPEEALKIAGSTLKKPTTDVVKLDNGNTILIDKNTGKILKTYGGGTTTTTVSSVFSPLVNTVSSLESTVAGKKAVKDQMENYLKNEDYAGAYNQVANTVASGLSGETKNRFENSRIDIEVLKGLRNKIKSFQDAGGNTNLLTGSYESILRKLGNVTDPKLTALAVELQREFQSYRQAMTGAAFTPAESREYESVNPSSKKSLNLNLSVIDGAIGQLSNRVDGTIKAKVPQASDLLKINKVQDKDYQSMEKDFETFTSSSGTSPTDKLNSWLGLPTK